MQTPEMSFFDWQRGFSSEESCVRYLAAQRWPNGFQCPHCGHDHGYRIKSRGLYECAQCARQTSVTPGTLFHSTNLSLTKSFWTVYWVASDKGGISALQPSKWLDVSWPTARNMLKKLRQAMADRDSIYCLSEWVELDDALVGGKRAGKRGRGAAGKTAVLIACENEGARAGFPAMEAVSGITGAAISDFAQRRLTPQITAPMHWRR